MPHLAQFPLSLTTTGSCHWLRQQWVGGGGGGEYEWVDTAGKLLSRQHFGCHSSLGFSAAAAWWHSMPLFFLSFFFLFFATFRFLILSSVCLIFVPLHHAICLLFFFFWRPPRGTFNVPQGYVIKYVSKERYVVNCQGLLLHNKYKKSSWDLCDYLRTQKCLNILKKVLK